MLRSWFRKRGGAVAAILVIAILGAAVGADYISSRRAVTTKGFAMGTVIVQKLKGKAADKTAAEIQNAIETLERERLSWRRDESDIARINSAGGSTVQVSQETASMLRELRELSQKSEGAFDDTLGTLTRLWDFDGASPLLPDSKALLKALEHTGWDTVKVDGARVTLSDPDVRLDLGAVGKGAACDRAKQILEQSKLDQAAVSVGGSVLVWSRNPEKTQSVAVRDPLGTVNEGLGVLDLTGCAVSTSGNYEKYFDKDGIRYHHILDPKTGMPAQTGLLSVTVVSESGMLSDALSTACYVLGYEKSLPLLQAYHARALFVFQDKSIRQTKGLAFTLTNQSYRLERGGGAQ